MAEDRGAAPFSLIRSLPKLAPAPICGKSAARVVMYCPANCSILAAAIFTSFVFLQGRSR